METEPTLNVKLLDQVMRKITRNPKVWYQGLWARSTEKPKGTTVKELTECGTAMCVAGWACVIDAGKAPSKLFRWDARTGYRPTEDDESEGEWGSYYVAEIIADNGTISQTARDALGLTYGQANVLFAATNSLDELKVMVKALKKNPQLTEHELDAIRLGLDY